MSDLAWSFVLDIAGARHQMASAHFDAGKYHEGRADFPAAAASYLQAARLRPEDAEIWTALGINYSTLDMQDHAEGSLRFALSISPLNAKALCGLATVALTRNLPAEAERNLDKAMGLQGLSPDVLLGRGNLRMLQQDFEAAEKCYRGVLDLFPTSGPGWTSLGNSLLEQGRHAEAKAAYRAAHDAVPQDPRIEMNLGLLELLTGDHETGWKHYESRRYAMVLR